MRVEPTREPAHRQRPLDRRFVPLCFLAAKATADPPADTRDMMCRWLCGSALAAALSHSGSFRDIPRNKKRTDGLTQIKNLIIESSNRIIESNHRIESSNE